MPPDISIVIPIYNREQYIEQTIRSALDQNGVEVEIIAIDDGSRDDSVRIARGFDSVTVVCQENAGVATARNNGLAMAKAEFVLFLDSDDLLHPDAAAHGIAALRADPDCRFAFGGYDRIDSDGRKFAHANNTSRRLEFADVLSGDVPAPSQTVFRTQLVRDVGGFDPKVRHCEDFELCLRLLDGGHCLQVPHTFCDYRRHQGQVTEQASDCLTSILRVVENARSAAYAEIDLSELKRDAVRRWKRSHGALILFEVIRRIKQRRFTTAVNCLARFLSHAPYSIIGFAPHIRRLLPR